MLQKEVADKAGIKKRALDMYLGAQQSMPPADTAVRIAQVLNVSVEYLVTGTTLKSKNNNSKRYTEFINDLEKLPTEMQNSIIDMVHCSAAFDYTKSEKDKYTNR